MNALYSKIKVENSVLHYEGKAIPLLSGEFHYWRVSHENWEAIADKILELGLNMVATYVPWNYHELKEGVYDFTGKTSPQRNLDGFLRLMAKKGLYVMVRPGPYIYSEWPFGGVPERASKFARLSPEFLEMSRHYIEAVAEVIVPHQITRGGTIIICQADNETYPELERCGSECGAFKKDGDFKDFLRERYNNDIAALNKSWKTDYSGFNEACLFFHEAIVDTELPMAERLLPEASCRMRYYDSFMFIGTYAATLVRNVASWLRTAGIDVPIAANGWSPLYQNFKLMTDVIDICGSDIYPQLYVEEHKINSVKDTWFYNVDIIKLQETDVSNGNTWSAEFEAGTLFEAGTIVPEAQHYRFITLFAAVNGLKGLNYYMLVNRDNWCCGPINEWGRTNANYAATRSAINLLKRYEPWNCRIKNDISLFCSKAHRVIDPGNFETCFNVLKDSGLTYQYFNPEARDIPMTDVLLYAGSDWISRQTADKLKRFIENGGTLVAFNRFPHYDEFGERLDMGFFAPDGVRPVILPVCMSSKGTAFRLEQRGHLNTKINVFYYKDLAAGVEPINLTLSKEASESLIQINVDKSETFCFGYTRHTGRGRIIHIGCAADALVLRDILDSLGIKPSVDCREAGIHTALHEHSDGRKFVSVLNRNSAVVQPAVRFTGITEGTLVNLETHESVSLDINPVNLMTPAHDVSIWELKNA